METLRGTIDSITYRNDDNGFTVFRLMPEHSALPAACVGVLPAVQAGESVSLAGYWEKHPKFGPQFSVSSYEIVRPTTAEGIVRLLSSGLIATIGESRARAIVAVFRERTLDVFDREPRRLLEVPGIGPKTLAKITTAWDGQRHLRDLVLFLQEFGATLGMAYKIHKAYGAAAREKIVADPYVLVEDIWGIGFKRADSIAQRLGFEHDSYKRIRAGLTHLLNEASADGHCFLPQTELIRRGVDLMGVTEERVLYSLDHSCIEKIFVREDDRIYLPRLFRAETDVAAVLASRIDGQRHPVAHFDEPAFDRWLARYSQRTGWQPDGGQIAACKSALQHSVFVLTGGPGTGKTTTLQVLVSFFRESRLLVALAAPTGRAAQRMGSLSGLEAKTIHRLLEYKPGGAGGFFARNAEKPLDVDAVIVDEVSMIDISLMRSFLAAVPTRACVILVGDSNQLPSVGAGNVLGDLIASGRVAHVELVKLFRQAAASRIVTAAHQIIHGETPRFDNARDDNCFFTPAETPEEALETVVDLVAKRIPAHYGFDPVRDVQVITPMHRGEIGTQNVNRVLQQKLNADKPGITRGETTFALGDKVMQVQNNYDLGVFNGDIGHVCDVGDGELSVQFGHEPVRYGLRDLDELVHAYCISIHKSQGCEFRAVVIPLLTQHFIMLQRNLVYTALTRARELCVFVGSYKALGIAVRNDEALARYTRLAERLKNGYTGRCATE